MLHRTKPAIFRRARGACLEGRSLGASRAGPHMHVTQPSESTAMDVPAAAMESAAVQRQATLGNLPEWDLSDLYPGRDSEVLRRDLTSLAAEADIFRSRHQVRLVDLSGGSLGAAVATYERLQEEAGRIMSFASLVHAGNLADPEIGRFFQTMQEKINAVSTTLLFF